MPPFDPDKYLAEKGQQPSSFDPDKYLAEKTASAPQAEPESTLSKVGRIAKQMFITGAPTPEGHPAPVEPSIGPALSYLGGVTSTGVIQGAKNLINGSGSMDDFKQALHGHAKSAPQQLEEAGAPTPIAYAAGVPLQVATDPFAGFMSMRGAGATPVGSAIGNRMSAKAEQMAEKSTLGTPSMIRDFRPGTGRAMLDNGVVRPFSGPADIADNAQQAIKNAYDAAPLKDVPATINKEEILKGLDSKIAAFASDESKAGAAAQLQKIRDTVAGDAIPTTRNLVEAEQIKRGFADPQNWDNPLQGQAPKAASGVYRDLVEQKATEFSPEIGQKYKQAKKLYQTLDPVSDAATYGASKQAAYPTVSLKDLMAAGLGGPKGYIANRIANSPRIQSTGAVVLNKASKWAPSNDTVASVISSRLAKPQSSETIRQNSIDQQTSPQAQQALKDSQE